MKMEINLKLTVDEVNVVLQVLSKAPYDISSPLIDKIRTQGLDQVNCSKSEELPVLTEP